MTPSIGGSKLLIVGGVHGVGKSSICHEISESIGATHIIASDLIRSMGRKSDDGNKRVESISQNQDVLVQALNEVVSAGHCYLLDGHFALFKSDGTISDIPAGTFRSIHPIAVALVCDAPAAIAERLNGRDQKRFDLSTLESLQAHERSNAEQVCQDLGIPLLITNTATAREKLIEFATTQFLDHW